MELDQQENTSLSRTPKSIKGQNVSRSPFTNIDNTTQECSLNDSEDWRDRVEVITKDVHENYVKWSVEAVTDIIDSAFAKAKEDTIPIEEPPVITVEDEEDPIEALQNQSILELPSGSIINESLEDCDVVSITSDDDYLEEVPITQEDMNSSILGMLDKFKNMSVSQNISVAHDLQAISEPSIQTEKCNEDFANMELEEIDEERSTSAITFVADVSHIEAEKDIASHNSNEGEKTSHVPAMNSTLSSILDQIGEMKITNDISVVEISDDEDEFLEAREDLENSMTVNSSEIVENISIAETIVLDASSTQEPESTVKPNEDGSSVPSEDADSEESFVGLAGEMDKTDEAITYDNDLTANVSYTFDRTKSVILNESLVDNIPAPHTSVAEIQEIEKNDDNSCEVTHKANTATNEISLDLHEIITPTDITTTVQKSETMSADDPTKTELADVPTKTDLADVETLENITKDIKEEEVLTSDGSNIALDATFSADQEKNAVEDTSIPKVGVESEELQEQADVATPQGRIVTADGGQEQETQEIVSSSEPISVEDNTPTTEVEHMQTKIKFEGELEEPVVSEDIEVQSEKCADDGQPAVTAAIEQPFSVGKNEIEEVLIESEHTVPVEQSLPDVRESVDRADAIDQPFSPQSDISDSDDEANKTVIEQTDQLTVEMNSINNSQESSVLSSTPKTPKLNLSVKNAATPESPRLHCSLNEIKTVPSCLSTPKSPKVEFDKPLVSPPQSQIISPPNILDLKSPSTPQRQDLPCSPTTRTPQMNFESHSPSTPEEVMSIAEKQAQVLSDTAVFKSPIPPPEQFLNDTVQQLSPIESLDHSKEISETITSIGDQRMEKLKDEVLPASQNVSKIPDIDCEMSDEDFFGSSKILSEQELLQDRLDNTSHDPRKSISSVEFDLISEQALKMAESDGIATAPSSWDGTLPVLPPKEFGSEMKEEAFDDFIDAAEFFQNNGLDLLESRAARATQMNLAGDSLFVKFDPLVANRESLAPASLIPETVDPRRASALMQFSPKSKSEESPRRNVCEETLVRLNDTVGASSIFEETLLTDVNATVMMRARSSSTPVSVEETATQTEEPVVAISEMKQTLQVVELEHQDELLRKTKEIVHITEQLEHLNNENNVLRSVKDCMKDMMRIMKQKKDDVETELQNQLENQQIQFEEVKKRHQEELDNMRKENQERQAEVATADASLFSVVKKCERMKEILSIQQRNEATLKEANEKLVQQMAADKETLKQKLIPAFEEQLKRACDENEALQKEKENDAKRSMIMMKKAELRIISQKETIEKQEKELQRLQAALNDLNVY